MSASAVLQHWQAVLARLDAGEPLRLMVGDRLYAASEIVLTPTFQSDLRANLIAEIEARIAELSQPEPPEPSAPSSAISMHLGAADVVNQ